MTRLARLLSYLAALAFVAVLPSGSFALHGTAQAAFPGANGRIAFVSDRDGNDEVYVMDADGSVQTNLTNDAADETSPAWSANGTKIAFVSDRDGNDEIYVMTASGSGVTRLTNNAAADTDPAWSPDGSKIVFASTRDHAEPDLYTMDADGGNIVRLTNNTLYDTRPAWSPDGGYIAFTRPIFTQIGYIPEVWTMASDGTDAAPISTTTLNFYADWAPDQSMLVFSRVYTNIEVNKGETRLTNSPAPDIDPAWSPDGAKIAFASGRDDPAPDSCYPACQYEIYAMNADGSSQTRLTTNSAGDTRPDWRPLTSVGGLTELTPGDRGGFRAWLSTTLLAIAAGVLVTALGAWRLALSRANAGR